MRGGPQIKRVVYLVTDGTQNPKKIGDEVFDPVVASQKLYDDGVAIFAIGVGNLVSADELKAITRDEDRVFLANHPSELVGTDFYLNLASKSCNEVGKILKSQIIYNLLEFLVRNACRYCIQVSRVVFRFITHWR